jgi:hypothetical protein
VPVVPFEPDGVSADSFGRNRFGGGLEHGQRAWNGFRRLARLAAGFVPFFIAHGAGAGVAEIGEVVM